MKKIILFLMVLFTTVCYAQSDFDIAQEFMSKKGIELVPNERSLTRGTDVPYSVFNGSEGKGFCVVANGSVVGYDTENIANEDDMPCCLKEILNNLGNVVNTAKTRGLTPRTVEPVIPKIKTKWNQCTPYNDSVAQKTNICLEVAMAQILHYLRVDFYGEGHFKVGKNPVDLYPATFNHDLIDREGDEGWAEETAKFFKYAKYGYTLSTSVSDYETLFGVEYKKEYFSEKSSRYEVYDRLLEMGRPIMVNSPNHVFIIDGRSEDGKYHVNFGWGGAWDGYYFFPDTEDDKQYLNANFEYNCETKYIVRYYIPVNETASITPVTYKQYDGTVYNLQGMRVGNSLEGLPKGIYIQSGKKYIVK